MPWCSQSDETSTQSSCLQSLVVARSSTLKYYRPGDLTVHCTACKAVQLIHNVDSWRLHSAPKQLGTHLRRLMKASGAYGPLRSHGTGWVCAYTFILAVLHVNDASSGELLLLTGAYLGRVLLTLEGNTRHHATELHESADAPVTVRLR